MNVTQVVKDGREAIFHQFDCLDEYLDAVTHQYDTDHDNDFYGVSTIGEAKELARHGWPDGLEKIRKFKSSIENIAARAIQEQELLFDNVGLDFDMALVLQGTPECWFDYSPREEGKVVRIAYAVSVSASLSEDMIATRGAAIAALVDLLEMHGIRVELDCFYDFKTGNPEKNFLCSVRVKDAGQPIDLDRMAFLLMHRGFNRCLAFSYTEQIVGRTDSWIGWSDVPFPTEGYDLVIERGFSGWSHYQSIGSMISWMKEQLKAFGVNVDMDGEEK